MQTSIGAITIVVVEPHLEGKIWENTIKIFSQGVIPLPILFKKNGFYTFNEGTGKASLFEWSSKEFYDRVGDGTLKAPRMVLNGLVEKKTNLSLAKFNYRKLEES